jgi:hypothetical protein
VLFVELLGRLPDIGVKGDVDRLLNHLLPLPCSVTGVLRRRGRFAAAINHPGELEEITDRGRPLWRHQRALDRTLDHLVAQDHVRAVGVSELLRGGVLDHEVRVVVEHRSLIAIEFIVPFDTALDPSIAPPPGAPRPRFVDLVSAGLPYRVWPTSGSTRSPRQAPDPSEAAEFYWRSGSEEQLRLAIELAERALHATAESEPSWVVAADRLAVLLGARFRQSGNPEDITTALALGRAAVARKDADWRCRIHLAQNLGLHFVQTGVLGDLDDALDEAQAAASDVFIGHQPWPGTTSHRPAGGSIEQAVGTAETLIELFLLRYRATGEQQWLQAATDYLGAAVEQFPDAARSSVKLNGLMAELNLLEFERTGEANTLEWAVKFSNRAVLATATSSPLWLRYGRDFALVLLRSYEVTGDESQLVRAFNILSEAMGRLHKDSPERPTILLALATVGLQPIPSPGLGLIAPQLDDTGQPTVTLAGASLAIRAIQDALESLPGGSREQVRAYWMLTSAHRTRYEITSAVEEIRAAADAAERGASAWSRFVATASIAQKLAVADRGASLHAEGIEALLEFAARDPAAAPDARRRAFVLSEAGKSRVLSEQLGRADLACPPNIAPTLLTRERALLDAIRALDAVALAGRDQPLPGPSGERGREALERELHDVWDTIAGGDPSAGEYVAQRRGRALSWEEIVALSNRWPRTAIISLFVLASQCVLFAISPGHADPPRVREVPLDEADWSDVLRELDSGPRSSPDGGRSALAWLPRLGPLQDAVAQLARGSESTLVVAHRQAHALPWGLLAGSIGAGSARPVWTVPALSVLDRVNRRRPSSRTGAAVLGNPTGDLPHAEAEAERVAVLLGCAPPLIGPDATREALELASQSVSTLHVAAHAAYGRESPLESHVVLHDGPWSAREALRAQMDAELVVLSACETARTGALAGEELAGLAQAFLYAGARALVVSLWPVNDPATARLMSEFHEQRRAGADIAAALAEASAGLREHRPDPWYWAAFVAVGDCGQHPSVLST